MFQARQSAGCVRLAALFFVAWLGGALAASAQTLPQPPQTLPRQPLNVGIHLISAELATDDATRTRGLMFRRQMGASEGMLFVFPRAHVQCFWMRNTYLPLSVAFLDDDGAIVNLADMRPLDDASHCSAQPVRYVLEMNQGWFAQRGIGPGALVEGVTKMPPGVRVR